MSKFQNIITTVFLKSFLSCQYILTESTKKNDIGPNILFWPKNLLIK